MATVRLSKGGRSRAVFGLGAGFAALIGVVALYATFTTYVRPDEIAVRQIFLGPNSGIQEDLYGPGLHFVMPGYERLHLFPRDMQLLEFNEYISASHANDDVVTSEPIRIQTSEGYQVTVDVTVAYRIVDPFKLIKEVGPGKLYQTSLMIPRSDKILRQSLGRLNAEEFYQGARRLRAAEDARQLLAGEVEGAGIEVWHLMVRHYTYDDRYQNAIEQRKIQDQTVFKNRAEALSSTEEAEKNRVLAEGQALIEVAREQGRSDIQMIAADADLYYRQKVAEAELLVALGGAAVIIVPTDGSSGVNPLDLDSLIGGW
jgi:regulator of protease activity HflC (stomatin/prohibitin superfamily)